MRHRFPELLAALFLILFAGLAIHPFSREIWVVENLPGVGVFGYLAITYRRFRFSNTAYGLMAIWLCLHTIGGHYTFAHVPFDCVTDFFGFSRNHFDRVAHFAVGLYAFPIAELLWRKRLAHPVVVLLFALTSIMAIACAYEIIEWAFAVIERGEAGVEFLGSQGDPWDAQKDMLADTLGALCGIALFAVRRDWRRPA